MFTLVVSYRNRDLARVRRFLDSLAAQTFRDFSLIFVDYGSETADARAAAALVAEYDFARYVYNDVRGWPWSSAHALNTGVRQVTTPYVVSLDVDMIFAPNFLEIAARYADEDRALYCAPYFLPKGFTDWAHPEKHLARMGAGDRRQVGGFQCMATARLHDMGGFDEFYRYWGLEDADLKTRLASQGTDIIWLHDTDDDPHFFHQWHPPASIYRSGMVPHSFWIQAVAYMQARSARVVRNQGHEWGRLLTAEDRPVFAVVDPETRRLKPGVDLVWVDLPPDAQASVGRLGARFGRLSPGSVMAIKGAFYPQANRTTQRLLGLGNRLLQRVGGDRARLALAPNLLHEGVAQLVIQPGLVADYYLNLDHADAGGVSVLVRA